MSTGTVRRWRDCAPSRERDRATAGPGRAVAQSCAHSPGRVWRDGGRAVGPARARTRALGRSWCNGVVGECAHTVVSAACSQLSVDRSRERRACMQLAGSDSSVQAATSAGAAAKRRPAGRPRPRARFFCPGCVSFLPNNKFVSANTRAPLRSSTRPGARNNHTSIQHTTLSRSLARRVAWNSSCAMHTRTMRP